MSRMPCQSRPLNRPSTVPQPPLNHPLTASGPLLSCSTPPIKPSKRQPPARRPGRRARGSAGSPESGDALRVWAVLTSRAWSRGEPLSQEVLDFKPDVILAADCVYFEPAFPLLMQTLHDLLALVPAATVFFCFKKRRRADMQFLKAARKAFAVAEIEDEDRPVFGREGLFLYAFTKK